VPQSDRRTKTSLPKHFLHQKSFHTKRIAARIRRSFDRGKLGQWQRRSGTELRFPEASASERTSQFRKVWNFADRASPLVIRK
jgi:hypothetical protein